MIKRYLPSSDPSSVTFYARMLKMADRLLATNEIQQIPINSRGVLIACMVLAIEEKFQRLSMELRREARADPERPEKGGIYFTPNKDKVLEEIVSSQAAYNMGIVSVPDLLLPPLRSLLHEVDQEAEGAGDMIWITLQDLKRAHQKWFNLRRRD